MVLNNVTIDYWEKLGKFSIFGVVYHRNYMKPLKNCKSLPLHEKYPYSEYIWSAFSRIETEYGEILSISPYSLQMRENADQKKSKY